MKQLSSKAFIHISISDKMSSSFLVTTLEVAAELTQALHYLVWDHNPKPIWKLCDTKTTISILQLCFIWITLASHTGVFICIYLPFWGSEDKWSSPLNSMTFTHRVLLIRDIQTHPEGTTHNSVPPHPPAFIEFSPAVWTNFSIFLLNRCGSWLCFVCFKSRNFYSCRSE